MADENIVNDYPDDLKKLEEELSITVEDSDITPNDIVAFNELRSCADLVRMYKTKQLDINPDFQRDVVWLNPAQTRFIDSLIKKLPIPSMCLSFDYNTEKRLMIDGLQRIWCIIQFLTNDRWKMSKLEDIDPKISGKTVEQIRTKYPMIYSSLENVTIPITVLRCDYTKRNHIQFLFTIFHRLNTGGNRLNNQEIRNCIFQGDLNNLLKDLVKSSLFTSLLDIKAERIYRFAHEELVLRFFAFYDYFENYNGKLANFLNEYMKDKLNIGEGELVIKRNLFERTIKLLFEKILNFNTLPNLSKTTTEGILIGIARNIDYLENQEKVDLVRKYDSLRSDEYYSVDNLKEGLSQREKVIKRLNKAVEIFRN